MCNSHAKTKENPKKPKEQKTKTTQTNKQTKYYIQNHTTEKEIWSSAETQKNLSR